MQRNSFYAIAVVAIAAAGAAYFVAQSRAPQTSATGDPALVLGLSEHLNDVTAITVTEAGNRDVVTLVRGESSWGVGQRNGYAADAGMVRKLLIEIADARLVEQKTARVENYGALGVTDIGDASASGVQIALAGLGDDVAFVIGNGTRGSAATYVRRSAEAASWVANKRLRVEQSPSQWLVKDLIDINASRVVRMTLTHADGEVVEVRRVGANFDVANLPGGKPLSSPSVANPMAEVLNNLKFDDVTHADAFDAGDAQPVALRFETSDGLVVEGTATAANNKYYVALTTTAQQQPPEAFADESADEGAPTPEQKAVSMFAAITAQSDEINARVDGWVFTIPLFKYENLSKRLADFVASDSDEAGPS